MNFIREFLIVKSESRSFLLFASWRSEADNLSARGRRRAPLLHKHFSPIRNLTKAMRLTTAQNKTLLQEVNERKNTRTHVFYEHVIHQVCNTSHAYVISQAIFWGFLSEESAVSL